MVNESLFNPGETVEVSLSFENLNNYWANDVTVNVQFLQSINYDWLVVENITSFQLGTDMDNE